MDTSKVIPLLKNGQPTGEWAVVVPADTVETILLSSLWIDNDIKDTKIVLPFKPDKTIRFPKILTHSTAPPEEKELLAENGLTEFEKVVIINEIKQ